MFTEEPVNNLAQLLSTGSKAEQRRLSGRGERLDRLA